MKKYSNIIIILLILIIITILCMIAYKALTIPTEEVYVNAVEEEVATVIDDTPIFTKNNYPKVDASLATQPLTDAFIKNFTGVESFTEEELDYTNTHPGYIRLIDGEVDLIVVTEPSEDELAYANEHNVELDITPVVREGFVFFVNKENPVDTLTIEEIQGIYTGKITNWKQVGGRDAEIQAFQRPANSGSQTGMLSLVMKDLEMIEPKEEDIVETMFSIVDLVSDYDNGIDSLGYSYYYYATTMFEEMDSEIANNIKLLKINGVEPNNQTIKAQEYPLETAYYIVTRKGETNKNTLKLKDAMLSDRGQKVAEEAGYVGVK